jgi:hypothetical protein
LWGLPMNLLPEMNRFRLSLSLIIILLRLIFHQTLE